MSEISSKKWAVGDRIITPANQRGLVTSADKKIGITWENGHLGEYTPKQIQAYGYQKFLEEKEVIAECNNSHNLTSAQELESSKNLLTGIINTSQEILENGESNLSELRQGIHFVQSQSEVLQQGMQVPERESRHQFRGSDRDVRVRNDSSGSGGTLWSETENNLEAVQASTISVQNSNKQKEHQDRRSKSRKQRELERGSDYNREWLHHGEMPGSSQSKGDGELRLSTHSSNGEVSRQIPRVVWTGTQGQRSSSPYQSQQARQPDRKPSTDETFSTHQASQRRKQSQMEQSSEKDRYRRNLPVSSGSIQSFRNDSKSGQSSNQQKNKSRRNLLGICLNLQLWIYVLGWELAFLLQCYNSDLNLSESQKLMNTAQASSQNGSPMSATTVTCEVSQCEISENSGEKSTLLQLRHHASPFQSRESDKEKTTPAIVSPPSNEQLNQSDPNSSVLKMCQDSSPVVETPAVKHSIFSTSFVRLPSSATMQNGFVSAQDTLPAPTLENGYCWLESPGALSSTGKGRPPGQSRQEAQLRQHGLLAKGEVLRPDFLLNGYNLPLSYLDPLDCRPATQLLEECDRQQEIFSILELPALPLTESSTSTPCVENQQPLTRANAKTGTYIIDQSETLGIIKDSWGFGFVVDWFNSQFTYNWERDDRLIGELAIAPQHLVEKFLEDNRPQLCTKCFQVVSKSYTCDRCLPIECTQQSNHVSCPSCESPLIKLDDGCGTCGWIPENFLEESKEGVGLKRSSKRRQRKGCLYKYIENKKLKSGAIASYPRVIGHRHPDNPTHWRWGFNWEEKIDGEWKGRSIGSIPVGAITLIQSMQNEGVSLEEIVGFIKRAKTKK